MKGNCKISVTLAFSLSGVSPSSTGIYEVGCPDFISLIRDVTVRGPLMLSNSSSLLASASFLNCLETTSRLWIGGVNNPQNTSFFLSLLVPSVILLLSGSCEEDPVITLYTVRAALDVDVIPKFPGSAFHIKRSCCVFLLYCNSLHFSLNLRSHVKPREPLPSSYFHLPAAWKETFKSITYSYSIIDKHQHVHLTFNSILV